MKRKKMWWSNNSSYWREVGSQSQHEQKQTSELPGSLFSILFYIIILFGILPHPQV